MVKYLLCFCLLASITSIFGQNDSTTSKSGKPASKIELIGQARKELLNAFSNNDPAEAALWRDSLSRLEDEIFTGLIWDERWLLYFWEESYGNLFAEVAAYDEQDRYLSSLKIQPSTDSLYESLDRTLYDVRYDMFQDISKAFLNEEERAFATLLLEYLLRMNSDQEDWNTRVDLFVKHYPASRFNNFLKTTKKHIPKPDNKAWSFDLMFHNGTWQGELDRTLKPLFGADMGVAYWKNKWNFELKFSVGGQKLNRDLLIYGDIWPKGDASRFYAPEVGFGYDLINSSDFRLYPTVGAGLSILTPRTPDEDEDPLPEYYSNFSTVQGHFYGAVTADVKLKAISAEEEESYPEGSFTSIRFRVGIRNLYFDKFHPLLAGNMFFVSVGFGGFIFKEKQP